MDLDPRELLSEIARLREENQRLRASQGTREVIQTIPGDLEETRAESLEDTSPAKETAPKPPAHSTLAGLGEMAQQPTTLGETPARYQLGEELGRGAVGRVVSAFDPMLRREVALKSLNPNVSKSKEAQERFLAEARVTAGLGHPNIVPVFDLGRDGDGWFFTMQCVRGRSLAHVIAEVAQEEHPRFGRNRLLGIVLQVCHAIAFAHARGVLHRDLKPQNVMVGDFGEVYLMDWGLAKAIQNWKADPNLATPPLPLLSPQPLPITHTQIGQVRGTPAYMAPEQAQGLANLIDERTDIFGLGAILYEVLTYQAPIAEVEVRPALSRAARADFASPRMRAPHLQIPPELEEICLRAMATSPKDRYQRASDMARDLELYLEGAKTLERKRAEAITVTTQGDAAVERLLSLEQAAREAAQRVAQLRRTIRPLDEIERKRELWQAEDTLSQLRLEHELAMWVAADLFHQALTLTPDNREVRERLMQLFFHRYLFAQEYQQPVQMRLYESLARRFAPLLTEQTFGGRSEVRIETTPEEADIFFAPYIEVDRCLVRGQEEYLGKAPLVVQLPWGSGVLIVRAEGYQDLLHPVYIRAHRAQDVSIRLFPPNVIGEGFCHIPAGAFLFGGDPEAGGVDARQEIYLEDFLIARRQVTCGEYAAFLNAIAARSPQQALQHAPRLRPDTAPFWSPGPDGRYTLPCRDFDGTIWERDWPVTWISQADAESYAAFRSARDQVRYRLPFEEEWEKAARGVDGRLYPWGNSFDPTFCRMVESVMGHPEPVPCGSYPLDRSPYGVLDMGGNVSDLTVSAYGPQDPRKVVRGGAYTWSAESCRTTWRGSAEAHQPNGPWGFRLVKEILL